jgi:hypothetical protein
MTIADEFARVLRRSAVTYGTLGIKDVIVTFSYPDCLSSSALASASFGAFIVRPPSARG